MSKRVGSANQTPTPLRPHTNNSYFKRFELVMSPVLNSPSTYSTGEHDLEFHPFQEAVNSLTTIGRNLTPKPAFLMTSDKEAEKSFNNQRDKSINEMQQTKLQQLNNVMRVDYSNAIERQPNYIDTPLHDKRNNDLDKEINIVSNCNYNSTNTITTTNTNITGDSFDGKRMRDFNYNTTINKDTSPTSISNKQITKGVVTKQNNEEAGNVIDKRNLLLLNHKKPICYSQFNDRSVTLDSSSSSIVQEMNLGRSRVYGPLTGLTQNPNSQQKVVSSGQSRHRHIQKYPFLNATTNKGDRFDPCRLLNPPNPEILLGPSPSHAAATAASSKKSVSIQSSDLSIDKSSSMFESTCTLEYEEEYDDRYDIVTKYSSNTDNTDHELEDQDEDEDLLTDHSYDIMSDVTQDIRYKHKIPFKQQYPCVRRGRANQLFAPAGPGTIHKRLRALHTRDTVDRQPDNKNFSVRHVKNDVDSVSEIYGPVDGVGADMNKLSCSATSFVNNLISKRRDLLMTKGLPHTRLTVSNVTVNKCTVEREIYNDIDQTVKENDIFPMRYADNKAPIYRSKDNVIGSIEDLRRYKTLKMLNQRKQPHLNYRFAKGPASLVDLRINSSETKNYGHFRTGLARNTRFINNISPLIECDVIHMV